MTGLSRASDNLSAAIGLLMGLRRLGLQQVLLCPGSRSAPLALAAGGLAERELLTLTTAIDERSAAFHALGMAASSGRAAAVITTSGTAVANLLPAAVEADRSTLPLIFLTADRPQRLKGCGANQTVNQEDFLSSVCRLYCTGPADGLHLLTPSELGDLASSAWNHTLSFPGPVHVNLPFEEPLHPSREEQRQLWSGLSLRDLESCPLVRPQASCTVSAADPFDCTRPGVVVAGPWRGLADDLSSYQQALKALVACTGWPVLADPLAAVPSDLPGVIRHWDLLLPASLTDAVPDLQVLRLGPLPASRRLESWLRHRGPGQLLITEGDPRCLDPLRLSRQLHCGLAAWWTVVSPESRMKRFASKGVHAHWLQADQAVQRALDQQLPMTGAVTEPALMHAVSALLPEGVPVMLAASSPVRDWQTFAAHDLGSRRCFSFRGASGIDGTLSIALGLARLQGTTLLICGDLALQHDSNGWLLAGETSTPLLVLLIDNCGGGIFEQLPIPASSSAAFDQLFAMPQRLDPLALAAAHGVPGRQLTCLEDLPAAMEWGLAQGRPTLVRVSTDRAGDAMLRRRLRDSLSTTPVQARDGTTDS